MLFKLSIKNITKSIKDYAIYFFTLILGVAIFYVFNAIDSQTVMMNVTKSTKDIIKLMTNMLSGVSVFVSFILGFLIIYASRFLMKRRNKEFGIYLTLGMSKRKISFILFLETLIIGIISLIVGLGIGFLLSQFMSILVANMFEADVEKFEFIFSVSASIKCLIYFGIMYLLVMFFNTISVSRCKLIDLLHANKKSEKIKFKSPWLCVLIFIISCALLGYAYYMVTGGVDKIQDANEIFIPIALGCISTFFIFWSLSGLLLKIVMSMKNFYYKGLNSFTLRQISSKVNTTVFSMAIICIMLFVTLCVLSSALSIKTSMTKNLNELAPADLQLYKEINLKQEDISDYYTEAMVKNSNLTILETLKMTGMDIEEDLKDMVTVTVYHSSDFTLKETLGNSFEQVKEQYKYMNYNQNEDILKISDYNKLAKLYGKKTYQLNKDEYIVIADYGSMVEIRNTFLKQGNTISVFGKVLKPKYKECQDGFLQLSGNHINSGFFVVPDDVVKEEYRTHSILTANYKVNTKEEQQRMEEKLQLVQNNDQYIIPSKNTRFDIAEASMGLGGMVTFIGLYLGIIFLISSAAILALKELSESSDNKERFKMLRKIGTDEKLINKALFRQIGIFFLMPLLLAIIHSIFGIKFCTFILETFGTEGLLPSIIMTACFIVVIYGGYFLITYFCSKNIIKEK